MVISGLGAVGSGYCWCRRSAGVVAGSVFAGHRGNRGPWVIVCVGTVVSSVNAGGKILKSW